MFSALKRIVNTKDSGNSQSNSNTSTTATAKQPSPTQQNKNGNQAIPQNLQKKFAKGVNYNMKIVIRGDCNTGKTCLWLRLQGKPFNENYETTDEIQIANINWNYKLSDTDIVKVEIWDVVDKSKKKRQLATGLKIDNLLSTRGTAAAAATSPQQQQQQQIEASLDAEFIDVYKNCNGCILVYDITKQWTWEYIERELPKIPPHIPVLVLGNHLDMLHHRTVSNMKCRYFIESLHRGSLGSIVRYTEASMRNGFGLTYLYKFLNLPFLQLQRETLMQQLEINAKDIDCMNEELSLVESNIDNEYENFQDSSNKSRRTQSEKLAGDALKNAKTVEQAREDAEKAAAAAALLAAQQASEPAKMINNLVQKIAPIVQTVTNPISELTVSKKPASTKIETTKKAASNPLEEIIPETIDEFNRFLNDSKDSASYQQVNVQGNGENDDDDDDDEANPNGNPMVTLVKDVSSSSEDEARRRSIVKPKASLSVTSDKAKRVSSSNYGESSQSDSEDKFKLKNGSKSIENDFILIKSGDQLSLNSVQSNGNHKTQTKPTQNDLIGNCNEIQIEQPTVKLTNDDFEFLEKMTSTSNTTYSVSALKPSELSLAASASVYSQLSCLTNEDDEESKKKKTKKKSKTPTTPADSTTKKKKHHSKKHHDDESGNSTKPSSSSKRRSSKSKSKKSPVDNNDDDEDEDDGNQRIEIKPDGDYEEI